MDSQALMARARRGRCSLAVASFLPAAVFLLFLSPAERVSRLGTPGSLAALPLKPSWWGLAVMLLGTFGAELFLFRSSFIFLLARTYHFLPGLVPLSRLDLPMGLPVPDSAHSHLDPE